MKPRGRSLELFYVDGRPEGMLTAQIPNWTGHVLMAPRTQIAEALAREEAGFVGVYLLLGELDGVPRAYVGEAESVADRLRSHDTSKDWWTTLVIATSSANALNKAHAKFLESRLVEEARRTKRVTLDNGNTPPRPRLSEAATANMEEFLENLLMVLPALRIDMFVEATRPAAPPVKAPLPTAGDDGVRFELSNRKRGLTATAILENGDFVVQAGSRARRQWDGINTEASTYGRLHAELRRMGVLAEDGESCIFAKSYAFKSPSAAASVVNGRPASGPFEWKLAGTETTYKDWEAAQLAADR